MSGDIIWKHGADSCLQNEGDGFVYLQVGEDGTGDEGYGVVGAARFASMCRAYLASIGEAGPSRADLDALNQRLSSTPYVVTEVGKPVDNGKRSEAQSAAYHLAEAVRLCGGPAKAAAALDEMDDAMSVDAYQKAEVSDGWEF